MSSTSKTKWRDVPADVFCDSVRDGTHDSPKLLDSGYPLITSKSLKMGQVNLETANLISEADFKEINRRSKVDQWDVLFSMIGTVGEVSLVKEEEPGYAIKNIGLFKCGDELKAKWLYYWFTNPLTKSSIKQVHRGSSQQYIPLGELRQLPISVPYEPRIMRSVVDILSTYDDLIENNRRRMALLEEAARQVYQEWFVRLRFPGREHTRIVDGMPEGWEKCLISNLGYVVTGKTPSTKEEDNFGGEIQFIKTPDMHGNVFVIRTETCLTEKGATRQLGKFLPAGTLLISCIGTVGVVSLTCERCQFNQQINAVIPSEEILRYYCYFALKDLKPRLDAIGGGVTMANVSKGKFENLDIMRPTSKLLRNFDDICRPIFNQILTLSFQNQKLRAARDLLLPRLMNGEISV